MKTFLCLAACLLGLSAYGQFMATTNTATLAWNAVSDPNLANYELFYWTGITTNAVTVPASQLSVRVFNLTWASTYTFAVKSVAAQGTNVLFSVFSTPITVIIPQQPFLPPAPPQNLHITGP